MTTHLHELLLQLKIITQDTIKLQLSRYPFTRHSTQAGRDQRLEAGREDTAFAVASSKMACNKRFALFSGQGGGNGGGGNSGNNAARSTGNGLLGNPAGGNAAVLGGGGGGNAAVLGGGGGSRSFSTLGGTLGGTTTGSRIGPIPQEQVSFFPALNLT